MTMTDKNGGPAFPAILPGSMGGVSFDAAPGMTLRQWYAGQALAAFTLDHAGGFSQGQKERGEHRQYATWVAQMAFVLADAMLKEGEKS